MHHAPNVPKKANKIETINQTKQSPIAYLIEKVAQKASEPDVVEDHHVLLLLCEPVVGDGAAVVEVLHQREYHLQALDAAWTSVRTQ
jgi:hypothetical protein